MLDMMQSLPSLLPTLAVGASGYLVFYILRFYYRVSKYPKGPTPLPFLGNILSFRGDKFIHEVLNDFSHKYGPTFTIFLGPVPIVTISDQQIGIEAMRKAAFAGRPDYGLVEVLFKEGSTDVFFGDFSREWEVLRRVAHDAIRKYTKSERHPHVVAWAVDQMLNDAKAGKDFDTNTYFTLILNAILASAAFGKQYAFDDEEFLSWKKAIEMQSGNGKIALIMFVPWFKYVYASAWKKYQESNDFQYDFIEKRYNVALETFDESNISNFCEAIISAQREAEAEGIESAKYMTTQNLMNTVRDLFFAGADTTKSTLRWIWLLMCKHPDMQEKVRQEVMQVLGEEDMTCVPTHEHKDMCPYTNAFIAEAMRFRTISPTGVPHKTTIDTELAGMKLKKGTIVLLPYYKALMDETVWPDPHVFRPERFLTEEGKFNRKPNSFFLSFGVGRRSCPGNQLASLTMFLVISRMMQQTRGQRFEIQGGADSVSLNGTKRGGMWMADNYSLKIVPQ